MKWYTAIGCKGEDGEGRLLVKTDNQEKVLTEMETMLWAALTWTICAENRIYSQMYRVLCITFGKERATAVSYTHLLSRLKRGSKRMHPLFGGKRDIYKEKYIFCFAAYVYSK